MWGGCLASQDRAMKCFCAKVGKEGLFECAIGQCELITYKTAKVVCIEVRSLKNIHT